MCFHSDTNMWESILQLITVMRVIEARYSIMIWMVWTTGVSVWDLHSEYMDRSLIHRLIFATYISAVLALCFADSNPDTVTGSYINYINTSVTVCPGFGNDKIVHLLMFFPFPILAIHAFGRNKKSLPAVYGIYFGHITCGHTDRRSDRTATRGFWLQKLWHKRLLCRLFRYIARCSIDFAIIRSQQDQKTNSFV